MLRPGRSNYCKWYLAPRPEISHIDGILMRFESIFTVQRSDTKDRSMQVWSNGQAIECQLIDILMEWKHLNQRFVYMSESWCSNPRSSFVSGILPALWPYPINSAYVLIIPLWMPLTVRNIVPQLEICNFAFGNETLARSCVKSNVHSLYRKISKNHFHFCNAHRPWLGHDWVSLCREAWRI